MKKLVSIILMLAVCFSWNSFAAEESAPKKAESAKVPVLAGFGNLTLDGLIQVWFVSDPTKEFSKGTTDDTTFRLRRGEIKLSGDMTPVFGFGAMFDIAKAIKVSTSTNSTGAVTGVTPDQSTTVLQDLTVNVKLGKWLKGLESIAPKMEASIGQQKTGYTEEGIRSSSKLDLLERSMLGRNYGDKRDIGLLIKDSHKYVDYSVGVFNGSGMNTADNNSDKTLTGRLILKPVSELKVGVSGLTGSTGADKADQNRYGCDAQIEKGPFSLKAEYLQGTDGSTDFDGYYIQPGCFIIADALQVVARYDSFDKNKDKDNDVVQEISGGLNYFIAKHNSKIQLEYLRRNNEATTDENVIMVGFQSAF